MPPIWPMNLRALKLSNLESFRALKSSNLETGTICAILRACNLHDLNYLFCNAMGMVYGVTLSEGSGIILNRFQVSL